jgi:hypothetical protein
MFKCKLEFLWYDFWIGGFWDRKKKKLYMCLIPMLVFSIWKESKNG